MDTCQKEFLVSAVATSTSTASSNPARVADDAKHTLYLKWTPGATSNVLTVKVYFSPSDANVPAGSEEWYQEQTWTLAANTKTSAAYSITNTAGSTDPVYLYYNLDISATKRIKITYSESVSAGVLTAALLSHTR